MSKRDKLLKDVASIEREMARLTIELSETRKALEEELLDRPDAAASSVNPNVEPARSKVFRKGMRAFITKTSTREKNKKKLVKIGVVGTIIDTSDCYVWIKYEDGFVMQRSKEYVVTV